MHNLACSACSDLDCLHVERITLAPRLSRSIQSQKLRLPVAPARMPASGAGADNDHLTGFTETVVVQHDFLDRGGCYPLAVIEGSEAIRAGVCKPVPVAPEVPQKSGIEN